MKKKKKNESGRHGQPTSGSLKPIKNKPIETDLNELIKSNGVANLITMQKSRDGVKQVVALYLQHAARQLKLSEALIIAESSKLIFYNALKQKHNETVANFANCCIKYFNNEKKITVSVTTSGPECGSLNKKIAFQQASKNAEKLIKQRINKIVAKIEKGDWNNIPNDLFEEYKGIDAAVKNVCSFISTIANDKLPSTISADLYNLAFNLYEEIEKYYQLNPTFNVYKIKKNTAPTYYSISQECATLIFCHTKMK